MPPKRKRNRNRNKNKQQQQKQQDSSAVSAATATDAQQPGTASPTSAAAPAAAAIVKTAASVNASPATTSAPFLTAAPPSSGLSSSAPMHDHSHRSYLAADGEDDKDNDGDNDDDNDEDDDDSSVDVEDGLKENLDLHESFSFGHQVVQYSDLESNEGVSSDVTHRDSIDTDGSVDTDGTMSAYSSNEYPSASSASLHDRAHDIMVKIVATGTSPSSSTSGHHQHSRERERRREKKQQRRRSLERGATGGGSDGRKRSISLRDNDDGNDHSDTASSNSYVVRTESFGGFRQRRSRFLVVYIIGFIALNVLTLVSRKFVNDEYGSRYVFFRSFLTNFLYDLYALAIVLYKLKWTTDITPSMRSIPLWKFAGIGFCDGFGDFMQSVGGVHTPGNWQVLLQQLYIPFTLLISFLLLRSRFKRLEVGGATLILMGVALAVSPLLFDPPSSSNSSSSHSTYWYSVLIYSAGTIPASASAVFKEYLFKSTYIDLFYLTCLISWCQVCIIWLFVPLESLPSFGGVALSDIGEVFRNGFNCFLGHDIAIENSVSHDVVSHCSPFTTRVTMVFSIGGFVSGLFQLAVLKHGSAALMVCCQALCLPLANLAFAVPFIMGESKEAFSWYNVGGLVVVCFGFLVYRYEIVVDYFNIALPVWLTGVVNDTAGGGSFHTLESHPTVLPPPYECGDDELRRSEDGGHRKSVASTDYQTLPGVAGGSRGSDGGTVNNKPMRKSSL